MREEYNETVIDQSISPQALITADEDGVGSDLAGFEAALCEITAGVITDGTHTVIIEESDSLGSGYTAVADADLAGDTEPAMASANDDQIWRIAYIGTKQFVRVTTNVTGSPSTGGFYNASIIKTRARHNPAGATQKP